MGNCRVRRQRIVLSCPVGLGTCWNFLGRPRVPTLDLDLHSNSKLQVVPSVRPRVARPRGETPLRLSVGRRGAPADDAWSTRRSGGRPRSRGGRRAATARPVRSPLHASDARPRSERSSGRPRLPLCTAPHTHQESSAIVAIAIAIAIVEAAFSTEGRQCQPLHHCQRLLVRRRNYIHARRAPLETSTTG